MRKAFIPAIAVALALLVSRWSIADMSSLPDTMAAAAIDRGGGPDVLSIHRVPVPKPGVGEVLIAVQAAGVGVWEADIRQNPGSRARFPLILGSDGSGTVVAVGDGVHGFRSGDQVYGTSGAFDAEYAAVRAENVAHIPKGMGFPEAGALAVSGLSALQGIDDILQLKAGETLLIHGATGGVGTLAVQFAKARGIKVLATASSDEGRTLLSRLGADAVVNGRTEDIAAAAKRFAPNGIDAVLGLVGGEGLEHCIDALRKDGRGRVAYLFGMDPLPKPRLGIRMTLYSFISGARELEHLNKAVVAAKLHVPIAAEYPLANAAQAHEHLAAGHLLGKIVLRVR
jgi:NADPH:quinone reductase-like Zn-dependent oxidoreductase